MKKCQFLLILFLSQAALGQQLTDYQQFEINSSRDTSLIGNKGTEIYIPALAFTDSSGQVFEDAPITIMLKEIYDQADMIMEGISTESEEGVLVSDGMVEVRGRLGDMPVLIHPSRPLKVTITSWSGEPGMELYESADSVGGASWDKREGNLEMDTCDGYRIDYDYKEVEVPRWEFIQWKKDEKRKRKEERIQYREDRKEERRQRKEEVAVLVVRESSSSIPELENIFGGGEDRYRNIRKRDQKQMDSYLSGDYLPKRKKRYSIYKKVDSTIHCIKNRPVRYEFPMRRFGWKNVDRLAWGRKTKVHYFLALGDSSELEVHVFFPKRNINLKGSRVRKGYRFAPIASEEPFILVAYQFDGSQHVYACFIEVYYFRSEIRLRTLERMTTGAFERKIKSYYE